MKKRVLSLFLAITLCLSLTPTGALAAEGQPPEQMVSVTQEAETDAGENAPPAKPEENPTEDAPAAAEKNTADKEPAAAGPGEPTMMGQNNLLALADEGQTPANAQNSEGGGIYVPPGSTTEGGGGTYIPGEDTRTEIWCTSKPDSIGRGYDGTTDGSTIPIDLTFTDGTDTFTFREGTGFFTAKKTFDSADAGSHTVTVEITLTDEAAKKYKLQAGEETFTIDGYINKAYPKLKVSLSKAACTVGEKILPLLSVEGAPKDAEVTYYYLAAEFKDWAGSSDIEGSEVMPKIDANTAISEPGTYYVYAKTDKTNNYEEGRSTTAELTVNEAVVEAASVTHADGTDGGTYESLPAALNAAQDGDTVKLLADHVTDADALNALGEDFTFEQYASIVPVVTKTLTLDLNHKTVDYLEVGFTETNEETQKKETLATGNLTVTGEAAYGRILNLLFMAGTLDIRSGEIGGSGCSGLTCDANSGSVTVNNGTVYGLTVLEGATVNVNGGSKHAGEWVVSSGATLNITDGTFGEVQFTHNGTIAISGGTFKSIKSYIAEELQPLMSLLDTQKAHAFYKGDDVQDGNATELTDVTVKEHTHTPDENGKCACGASCVASVTSDAQSTNYTSLDDALNAAQNGDTVTLLSDVDLGETYVTIDKSITFDLGGKTLSSSKTWSSDGVLLIKNAAVTVKNGTVNAAGIGNCAIRAYRSGARMTLEAVTATVTSDNSSVMVGDFGSAVIKSGDYQGLYVGAKSRVTLEGGTFRPYMDNITNKNVKSIFWKVNETTDDTSRDCMELLGDGCVYVDENGTQVRTGGGFNAVVTVQKGTAIDAPVAKIGDVEYASLSKAINAVQNGGTITLLDDLDLGNGAVLQVDSSKKNFTIDLDNHTLSADDACLIMLHNGSQLTLKNGTLDGSRCMSYYGVLHISSNSGPKLTLENVTAKSGTVTDTLNGQRSVPLVYVTNGTVVFDGGNYTGGVLLETDGNAVLKSGTFRKGTNDYSIKTKDSGKHLSDYLDESLFWNGNTVLDLSSETQTADEVTVRPCEHNWENGKCTVCLKVCDHGSADGKSMTEDPCHTCGMKAAAQVDITGSATKYFPSFTDALVYANQNSGCTLKLLADVTETTVMISNPFIFDLNGHNVDALSVDAKATIKDSGTTKGRIGKVTVYNEKVTDLTLGGLLEEGYAFKYETGYWADDSHKETISGLKVTVEEAPIQSVKIYAKDKNHKEVPTTMAYGTTGEVTLVSSCRMGETSGADLSYLWYKLEGAAATAPLEGATGANYTLPDNLAAGTHTYLLICTSGGYSKSAEITITVTPISLEGATVTVKNPTYNGQEQSPAVTVKLGETTLTRGTDFYVTAQTQTDAGSYTLTVTGKGNYTGKIENVNWKIEPMQLYRFCDIEPVTKVYDGTAVAPIAKSALTFHDANARGASVTLPEDAYDITNARFTMRQGDGTYVESPEAGDGKSLSFTVTLKSGNYVFKDGTADVMDYDYTTDKVDMFTITQDTISLSGIQFTQYVFNDLAKTYEIDLNQFLDTILPEGGKYGDIQYGRPSVLMDSAYYPVGGANIGNGKLRLSINKAASIKQGDEIGTVAVKVETTNYQPFTLTIHVIAQDKLVPVPAEGNTVSATDIIYGQALADSKLTVNGTMQDSNTGATVKGTFAWKNKDFKPDASDSYEAEWTFTPAEDYEEYATATGTVTIKVKPAKLTVSVKASSMYYTGEEQIASIIATGESVDSTPVTFTYSTTENGIYTSEVPAFTDAGTYTVYYKAEAANHATATGTFTVTIDPLPISLFSVSSISKTYDGSADVTLTADKLTFLSKTAKIKLPDTALSFSDAQFTSKQEDGSYLPSPEVGNGKALSFTMTLTSNNYVFEGKSEGTTEVSDVFATNDVNRFTITKAAAPTMQPIELTVINGLAKTYLVNLPALPTLGDNCKYGSIKYEACNFDLIGEGGYANSTAMITSNDEFQLTVPAVESQTEGSVGTVGVKITTDNYQDMLLTVEVIAKNKIVPVLDGDITATPITFGQILRVSTITGTMKDDGNTVKGTFEWTNPSTKPDKAGDYQAEWTFTPAAGYEEYATVTGNTTVKVNKATPTFTAPTAQENLTYTGQEQALITAGMTDYGTMQYSLTENGTYSQDIPTGTDAGAYTVWYRVFGDANHNDTAPASVVVSIGKKSLTITGVTAASKTYDGTTNADISDVTFDNVTLNRGTDYTVTASFDDASVDNDKNITATVTLMEQVAKNYFLEQSSFTATGSITKAAAPRSDFHPAVTVINDLAKTYEMVLSNDYLPMLSSPCEYGNVSYSLGGTYLTDGYKDTVQVKVMEENGQYKLKLTVPAVDYNRGSSVGTIDVCVTSDNYRDFYLTIGVKAKNKDVPVPDGTISASDITYGQALNDSKIAGKMKAGGNVIDGTFTWTNGTFKPAAGDYTASWTFTPAEEEYATATGIVTVTVNPKAVTVSGITAKDKVYDGNTNATLDCSNAKFDGILENDTLTVTATGTFESANAGKQKVKISGFKLGGASAANYVPSTENNQTETTATITAKEVTVTITPNGGTYGSVTAAAAVLSGVVDGETVPVTLTYTGNGYNSTSVPTDVDSYTVTASIADRNYILTGETTANFVITPKTVIVSGITAKDKAYDGTTNATLDFSNAKFDGILENDKLTVTAKGVFEKTEAGKWNVAISDLTLGGNSVANYVLAESGNQTEITATITAKEVTVAITPNGGTYGSVTAAAAVLSGVVDGETVPVTLTYTGNGYNSTSVPTDVDSYTVTASIADSNYILTGETTANFVITPKTVIVSGITAKDKAYDGTTNATLDFSNAKFDGILENDKLTVTAKGVFEKTEAGKWNVAISDLTLGGNSVANYVLAESGNQTETTATITAREVTVAITSHGGTYGSVTAAAAVLSGVVDGETVPVTLTYTGNGYNSTSVPTDVDSYSVTASIADNNYILTGETTANFVITPKTVIVSGITAKDKAYDGTTNATLDFSNTKFDGILENDKLTVTAKGVFEKTEAGKWNVAISDLTLGGNSVANYVLAESGNQTETKATITAKEVTVTITPNGGTYGSVTAAAAVLSGVVDGETVPVTLTYTGTANDGTEYNGTTLPTKAGTYTIKASITDDNNYTLDANTATAEFTVAKRPATVTPDNKTKVYEKKDPDLTYAVSGVLDGETLKGITLTRAEGENAGEYAITATADAGANPNYDVTFAEGKFTINPKSIDGAKVVLGKALTANSAEQTQTVEKVLLGDKEIPADSYTVTDNTATAPGKYTLTITAKGNYTGTVEQTYVIVPAKTEGAPGEEITIGSGKVKVNVKSEGTVPPATLLTDKAELLAMLVDSGDITAEELAQIADGASVDIVLTVKEANVHDEVKTAMAQAAKDYTIGQYLDISLFKYMTVNGSQQAGVPLHTTRDALTISVVVPDALINTNSAVNRTYCIVRRHDGAITVLDAAFDAANKTLTFKTDRFSIYAIAYKDTAVPSSGSNPGSNNSSNDSEAKKNEVAAPTPAPTPASTSKPSTVTAMPQTGDTSNPTLYVVLLVASLLGLAVVFVCKKRNDK